VGGKRRKSSVVLEVCRLLYRKRRGKEGGKVVEGEEEEGI
jgi:hypothetical protein